jgi:hypothetical protein
MSIFVQSAASAFAMAVKQAGVWVAWGNGDGGWDILPVTEPVGSTALVAETGRRRAQVIEFVVEDPSGDITVPQGSYSTSAEPTSTLYVRCNFSNTDAVGQEIREAAIFIGTLLVGGLPGGQDYFVPANIDEGGVMLMLERFAVIERTSDFSVALEFVMTL